MASIRHGPATGSFTVSAQVCVHTHPHTHPHIHTHTHIHTFTHTHTHTLTHTLSHTHPHTHTPAHKCILYSRHRTPILTHTHTHRALPPAAIPYTHCSPWSIQWEPTKPPSRQSPPFLVCNIYIYHYRHIAMQIIYAGPILPPASLKQPMVIMCFHLLIIIRYSNRECMNFQQLSPVLITFLA